MDLEFDPAKDAINQAKHRISLAAAADLDFESLFEDLCRSSPSVSCARCHALLVMEGDRHVAPPKESNSICWAAPISWAAELPATRYGPNDIHVPPPQQEWQQASHVRKVVITCDRGSRRPTEETDPLSRR